MAVIKSWKRIFHSTTKKMGVWSNSGSPPGNCELPFSYLYDSCFMSNNTNIFLIAVIRSWKRSFHSIANKMGAWSKWGSPLPNCECHFPNLVFKCFVTNKTNMMLILIPYLQTSAGSVSDFWVWPSKSLNHTSKENDHWTYVSRNWKYSAILNQDNEANQEGRGMKNWLQLVGVFCNLVNLSCLLPNDHQVQNMYNYNPNYNLGWYNSDFHQFIILTHGF